MSVLISNIVFDEGKFKFSSLFSFVYRMRSWNIGGGSADTNTTSSDTPSFVKSVRKTLFSLPSFNVLKTVESVGASLFVGFGNPLINWRQAGTDVLITIASLRSSERFSNVFVSPTDVNECEVQLTYCFAIWDLYLMKSVVEMHIEYQILIVILWCWSSCRGRTWKKGWKKYFPKLSRIRKIFTALPASFVKSITGSVGVTVASSMFTSLNCELSSSAKWTAAYKGNFCLSSNVSSDIAFSYL